MVATLSSVLAARPEALRGAAGKLSKVADGLSDKASATQGAAGGATAEWSGVAASLFGAHFARLCSDQRTGANAMQTAAAALTRLAGELEAAQTHARAAQSYAASAESLRQSAASTEPSPATHLLLQEAHAATIRAVSLESEALQMARDAAARAAATFSEVSGMVPSRGDPAWNGVMQLSAADLTSFLNMQLAGLPGRVQALAGRELARLVADATSGDFNTNDIEQLFAALDANKNDGDFAAGFFEELGGKGTTELVIRLQKRFGEFTHESEVFTEPLSIALGAASRTGRLDTEFVEGLFAPDEFFGEGPLSQVASLIEHGRYEADFIVAIAERGVINQIESGGLIPPKVIGEDGPIDLRAVILEAVARTPEAARDLLLGEYDSPHPATGRQSYMTILLDPHVRFLDGGEALSHVLLAATVESQAANEGEANKVVLALLRRIELLEDEEHAVRAALGRIGGAWWEDFAHVAYAGSSDVGWAKDDSYNGEATDKHVRASLMDVIRFLELGVSEPQGRRAIMQAMFTYGHEQTSRALGEADGDRREHMLQKIGASYEMFSIADDRYGRQHAEEMARLEQQEKKLMSLLLGAGISKVPLGKVLGLGLDKILDEHYSDKEFAKLKAFIDNRQEEVRLRLQLKLTIIDELFERGDIDEKQRDYLNRYLIKGGKSKDHEMGVGFVDDLFYDATDKMDNLYLGKWRWKGTSDEGTELDPR